MNIHRTKKLLIIFIFILSACSKATQAALPTPTIVPSATETSIPATPTPTDIPTETPLPEPTQDPLVFGAIGQNEIQAYALESVVNAIFGKAMDGYIATGNIIEYQVMRVTVFPSSSGTLYAEVTYSVHTTDSSWLVDGGTQANDNWIQDKCNRFDFVTTETEFQLKNRRTCN